MLLIKRFDVFNQVDEVVPMGIQYKSSPMKFLPQANNALSTIFMILVVSFLNDNDLTTFSSCLLVAEVNLPFSYFHDSFLISLITIR